MTTTVLLLEVAINGAMVVEVIIRILAYQPEWPRFFRSRSNVVDFALVVVALVTLLVVVPFERHFVGEMGIDTLLLIVRNGTQWLRLFAVLRRGKTTQGPRDIRLDTIVSDQV